MARYRPPLRVRVTLDYTEHIQQVRRWNAWLRDCVGTWLERADARHLTRYVCGELDTRGL